MVSVELKIPFGERDGRLFDPISVDRGKACNCVCPECRRPLVAKRGNIKIPHFAHEGEACGGGRETAIHKAAKQVLQEHKKIWVPELRQTFTSGDEWQFLGIRWPAIWAATESLPGANIELDAVYLERAVPGTQFIADAMCSARGKQLAVEIAVTHFSEPEKVLAYDKAQISAVEIDLSDWAAGKTLDDLAARIGSENKDRKWIYNTRMSELFERAANKAGAPKADVTAEELQAIERRVVRQFLALPKTSRRQHLEEKIGVSMRGRIHKTELNGWHQVALLAFIHRREGEVVSVNDSVEYFKRVGQRVSAFEFETFMMELERGGVVVRTIDSRTHFKVIDSRPIRYVRLPPGNAYF